MVGEVVTHENVRAIRPGDGCAPKLLEEMLGKKFVKNLLAGTPMTPESVGIVE
jgi:N-acetylneuraminate synthase